MSTQCSQPSHSSRALMASVELSLYSEQRFIRQLGQLFSQLHKPDHHLHHRQVSLNSVFSSQLDFKLIEFSVEY